MPPTPPEVIVANLIWFGVWIAGALLLVLLGKRPSWLGDFRRRALAQWRPALILAALTLLGLLARDLSASKFSLGALLGDLLLPAAVFAQALIGFAIAYSIPGFEPLPVSAAVSRRKSVAQTILLTALSIIIAAPLGLLLGSIGTSVGAGVAHETIRNQAVASEFPSNPLTVFLMLLAGAGIAEEVVYRLVILSLVWRLTRSPWLAVIVAAILHGLYHLTPLDSLYLQFWQYPVAQVVGTICISAIWGVLYVRRGLGAAITGHTLADWLSVMILLR